MVPFFNQVNAHTVAALNRGERIAFDTIYEAFSRAIFVAAFKVLKQPEQAEDIVQECFIRLWNNRQTFTDEKHVRNYLYKVVMQRCSNWTRDTHRVTSIGDEKETSPETTPDLFAEICRADLVRQVHSAIESLPRECRKVMYLYAVQGLSNAEIAAELGIAVNTVKNQKQRGKELLKKKFGNFFGLVCALVPLLDL